MRAKHFTITHHVVTVDADRYVAQYRDAEHFIQFCAQCDLYGKVWSCPPFDRDVSRCMEGFEQVTIYGTKITFAPELMTQCASQEQSRQIVADAIEDAWKQVLPFLYAQEERHPGSRIFTGRCRLCRPKECSRIHGMPCRHPDKMRPSLEAVGFDVSRTASELLGIDLQWSTDGHLPPYVTLVTALFTREAIEPAKID